MPVPDENGVPYFDVVFGVDGDLTAVPDAVQPSGSISFLQGWGPFYAQDPTIDPATALFIDRAQTNQLFNYITDALQAYQQFGTPAFITSAMNGGSPFSYSQYARVYHLGVVYSSLVNANTDTPPSSKWKSNSSRIPLTGDTTFYVAPTGNDSTGNGTNSAPWLTPTHALSVLQTQYDLNGFLAFIQLEDGTYTGNVSLGGGFLGGVQNSVVLGGNAITPANVILTCSTGTTLTVNGTGASLLVQNMEVTSTGSATSISAGESANINFGVGMIIGPAGNVQINAQDNSKIFMNNDYKISGGANNHMVASVNASISASGVTVTLTGTPAFANQFANSNINGSIYLIGNTYSGSATGVRYSAILNGVIQTNTSGSATTLPGNSPGSTASGGEYN